MQSVGFRAARRIALASLLPLLALAVLFAGEVPIGTPGYLIYRYSPLAAVRLLHALPALVIGAVGVVLLGRGVRADGSIGRAAYVATGICWSALVIWTFIAPPAYVAQHVFNLESPSHDGAFVREGRRISSIRHYVSAGFYESLQRDVDQMQGTRVLSNPQGMTVLAVVVKRFVDASPRLQSGMDRWFGLGEVDDPGQRRIFAQQLLLGMLLSLGWGAALIFGYKLCRLWMPPLPAIAVGLACVFNPATVNFTPGKDAAQLLTVLAILYTGLAGYTRSSRTMALLCGAVFALSLTLGLVHIWIVLILITATLWHSVGCISMHRPLPPLKWLTRCILPAAVGFAAVAVTMAVLLDWNIIKAAYAVAQRYPQIQRYLINGYWTLVGLPMFLLFAGPMFWYLLTALRPGRGEQRPSLPCPATAQWAQSAQSALSRSLVVSSVIVMTFTYFSANNNETPRLWIPFLALLPVALALRRDVFRTDAPAHRRVCLTLIALQISVSVLHWSMMDVRESEDRLQPGEDGSPPRMWGELYDPANDSFEVVASYRRVLTGHGEYDSVP